MTARASSAVLVGREAEMAALRAALKRADSAEPAVVLIGGEAGVGKTRLVEDFGRFAQVQGAQVLSGRCVELGEEGLPFAPFAAALRELLRRDGAPAFAGHEQEFARLLPELGPAGPEAASDTSRGYLFDLVTGLFDRVAAERPLVLVLEDLHWADRSTRDLLAVLVRQGRAARMLLVGTYRADELTRGHPLRAFLAELDRVRGVERLDLGRLDRAGTAAILADLTGAEPPPTVVDSIHARAQGNPFFIEQLAVADVPAAGCYLPDSLRDLLLARIDQLPEPAQRMLHVAAAGGNRVGHRLLAEVAGMPPAELDEALRAAVAAQLIVVDPDEEYEFRHALVREAVHDDLLPGEHGRLHARYAAAIEADPTLVTSGRAPAAIAHHWHAAHDHPRALAAALHAAAAAGKRYAYAEKSALLERVLELWAQVPDAAERINMAHLDVLEAALSATVAAGDYARGLLLTKAALAEVDRAAEPLRAARLLERRAKLLRTLGKSDGAAETRQAYELAGRVDDPAQRATLLADIADSLARLDPQQGSRVAEEAMAAARDLGDGAAHVSATITHGRLCGQVLPPEEGLAELRRAAETAERAGNGPGLVRALVNISDLLYEVGDYATAADTAERGIAAARRFGISRSNGAFLFSNRAEALLALGRWDEAEALCAESARLDPPGTLAVPWLLLQARLRLARGHPGAAEALQRSFSFLSRPFLEPQFRLPLLELRVVAAIEAGDAAGAATAATAAVADEALAGQPRWGWPLLAAAAHAGRAAGDGDLAELVRRAAGLAQRYPAERAYAAQTAAELAAAGADLAAWRAAVAAWRADGQPYPLGSALLRLAEAAAGAGERGLAAEAVGEARDVATRLAATGLRDRADRLARRLGLRGPDAVPGAVPALTARELEVLRLVAAGHSNRRIAEHLFITAKTASVHVSRIIAKLAVSNRIEAAAVARRLGLLDGDDAPDAAPAGAPAR